MARSFEQNRARLMGNNRMAMDKISLNSLDDLIEDQIRKNAPKGKEDALIDQSMGDISPNADPRLSREVINEKARINKELVAAGIKLPHTGGLHEAIDTLGVLEGNVPGPFIKRLANDRQWRYHTDITPEVNPITGTREVVPYMDPSNPNKVLITKFGMDALPASQRHMIDRSEVVAENALKLMGTPTKSRGDDGRALSDFVIEKDGKTYNIDAMITDSDRPETMAIPAYTALVPYEDYRYTDKRKVVSDVQQLVRENNPNNENILDVVERLTVTPGVNGKMLLGNINEGQRAGKLMRADPSVVKRADEFYHGLVVPGYKKRQFAGLKQMTLPPQSIQSVNLKQALNAVRRGEGASFFSSNAGYDGKGYLRSKVQYSLPTSAEYINDVSKTHPLVQQLLDETVMRYKKEPQR